MIKGIRAKEFQSKSDAIIFHGGCNDINPRDGNKKLSEYQIAENIIEIAELCRSYGVKDVILSGLICRKDPHQNRIVANINNI